MRGQRPPRGPKRDGRSQGHQGPRRPQGRPDHRSHDGGRPPQKDKARWVVGIHSCEEALKVRPRAIREVWLREDWANSETLRTLGETCEEKRVSIKPKSQGQLDQVGSGHQGVAMALTENPEVNWDELESTDRATVLILDGIEDPHNLGSMIRTGWLAGVSAIFIPTDRAVGLTPAACKVASGGAEHVPVESFPNIASVLERLKEIGFWTYGLAEAGTRKPWEFNLPSKVAWVIGSEGSGMRKATERACDELVRIPQVNTGSSYNAAIAAAMALAETCRQTGFPE